MQRGRRAGKESRSEGGGRGRRWSEGWEGKGSGEGEREGEGELAQKWEEREEDCRPYLSLACTPSIPLRNTSHFFAGALLAEYVSLPPHEPLNLNPKTSALRMSPSRPTNP